MKTFLPYSLLLITILIALAGCSAEEPFAEEPFFSDGTEDRALERVSIEDAPQPQSMDAIAMESDISAADGAAGEGGDSKIEPSLPAQERIIVHTAYLTLVTDDVADTIGRVGDLAGGFGGWVVNSDRSSRHSGSIAVRVPAESLDEALAG